MQEYTFGHRHLLGIEGLTPDDINHVLDLADGYVELNRQAEKKNARLRGRTLINCFFENSTRTRTSFEVAGKRLGADRSEEHTSELQSRQYLVCRLLLEKKNPR